MYLLSPPNWPVLINNPIINYVDIKLWLCCWSPWFELVCWLFRSRPLLPLSSPTPSIIHTFAIHDSTMTNWYVLIIEKGRMGGLFGMSLPVLHISPSHSLMGVYGIAIWPKSLSASKQASNGPTMGYWILTNPHVQRNQRKIRRRNPRNLRPCPASVSGHFWLCVARTNDRQSGNWLSPPYNTQWIKKNKPTIDRRRRWGSVQG